MTVSGIPIPIILNAYTQSNTQTYTTQSDVHARIYKKTFLNKSRLKYIFKPIIL